MFSYISESMPWFAKLSAYLREAIYQYIVYGTPWLSKITFLGMKDHALQFAMVGTVAPKLINTQTIVTAIVVGTLSAGGSAYLTVQTVAAKVEMILTQQARIEQMIEKSSEISRIHQLTDETRLSRIEGALFAGNSPNHTIGSGLAGNGQGTTGMGSPHGMNGGVRR